MEIVTRQPLIEETPALRYIWENVFESGDDEIFFRFYYKRDMCLVAVQEGTPVSAGYLLPAGDILCGESSIPCAMIYAVATLPEYRNRGYGAGVVRELISTAYAAGYPSVVLCPSSDSLFEYYSEHTELREWFYVSEQIYSAPPEVSCLPILSGITACEYNRLRETVLAGTPHIVMEQQAIEYQSLLCNHFGGGLYCAETSGGLACAVVEKTQSGTIWIKELLAADDCVQEVVSAIAAVYRAPEYIVRTQAHPRGAVVRRFGMLSAQKVISDVRIVENAFPWYGLAFD